MTRSKDAAGKDTAQLHIHSVAPVADTLMILHEKLPVYNLFPVVITNGITLPWERAVLY